MAQRTIEIQEQRTKVIWSCDRCGIDDQNVTTCPACTRQVCHTCRTYDDREPGDYNAYFCDECWAVGEPFRKRISDEQDESYQRCQDIESEWYCACPPKTQEPTP